MRYGTSINCYALKVTTRVSLLPEKKKVLLQCAENEGVRNAEFRNYRVEENGWAGLAFLPAFASRLQGARRQIIQNGIQSEKLDTDEIRQLADALPG